MPSEWNKFVKANAGKGKSMTQLSAEYRGAPKSKAVRPTKECSDVGRALAACRRPARRPAIKKRGAGILDLLNMI